MYKREKKFGNVACVQRKYIENRSLDSLNIQYLIFDETETIFTLGII